MKAPEPRRQRRPIAMRLFVASPANRADLRFLAVRENGHGNRTCDACGGDGAFPRR
jgi:hypothetical protein